MDILIVDDSPLARVIVSDILHELPFVNRIEAVRNGKSALEVIQKQKLDLIILDVEMPVMNGIEFLQEKRMRGIEIPVIMLSSYTQKGAEITLKALELGAMDFVPKPDASRSSLKDIKEDLLKKIENFYNDFFLKKSLKEQKRAVIEKITPKKSLKDFEVLLIGASTGGPKVIFKIIRQIPRNFPLPIVIVQHMPEFFTRSFAQRLDTESSLLIFEAEDLRELEPGQAVVAKGNKHLLFRRLKERTFRIFLSDEEKYNSHRPSVDKTLLNLIELTNGKVVAIILTGMGKDGLESCRVLKEKNGFIIAQDEETSVIFGMNRRVIEEGYADVVLPDDKIVDYLLTMNEF
ncbi:MAG: chemotaxis-specific protein-glutamate methyltransferase CheB [Leptospiraceae bacterium]|nr:chemotaxis-specific protein-glutamate methyltransferase CheB [Leptospiraceae bacterium]MDW7975525.1 chemotaxis-specific protein-glutamate methyltransferase CheB [Leptospiraceae bacterium]